MPDIEKYAPRTGRIIGEDGEVYNLVDLLQNAGGGTVEDGSITTEKIADGAVTTEKLAADAKAPLAGTADTANAIAWASVSGKPTTFTPSSHTHDISDVTNLQTTLNNKLTATQAAAQENSMAEDVATLVTDFNALLQKLRDAGIMAP
jgi:hypothetical protein